MVVGELLFSYTTGIEFQNGMTLSSFFVETLECMLSICSLIVITFSSHSSNIGVFLIVIYGVGGISSGTVRSEKVVSNRY